MSTVVSYRQKLYQDYSLQVTNLNKKLTTDANQVKKHGEKLCVSIRLRFEGVHCVSSRGSSRGFLQQVRREGTGHELRETRSERGGGCGEERWAFPPDLFLFPVES